MTCPVTTACYVELFAHFFDDGHSRESVSILNADMRDNYEEFKKELEEDTHPRPPASLLRGFDALETVNRTILSREFLGASMMREGVALPLTAVYPRSTEGLDQRLDVFDALQRRSSVLLGIADLIGNRHEKAILTNSIKLALKILPLAGEMATQMKHALTAKGLEQMQALSLVGKLFGRSLIVLYQPSEVGLEHMRLLLTVNMENPWTQKTPS